MAATKPVKYSVVDAFTDSAFKGNPAAVCFLEEDRDDRWLQAVAAEFNISETCFLTPTAADSDASTPPRFGLRWFTPTNEVDLCGHATLAAAYTIFNSSLIDSNVIEFATLSGILTARKVPDVKTANGSNVQNGDAPKSYLIELNFPADPSDEFNSEEVSLISNALGGASVIHIRRTKVQDNLLVVLPSAKEVADLQPQLGTILQCPGSGGVIATGIAPPESEYDFYSRFFCPKHGIDEDPVTGSAHCALAPYWCKKLGKSDVFAYQASPRGGSLSIHLDEQNQRVLLRGKAVTVMEGTVLV